MAINNNTSPIADLVMVMLAVNNWRMEQSGAIFDGLQNEGLFDPTNILSMEHGELHHALVRAGYTKSSYVIDLLCDRLFDMARRLTGERIKQFESLCNNGDKEELKVFLVSIKGVGPKVFENFCTLRGL